MGRSTTTLQALDGLRLDAPGGQSDDRLLQTIEQQSRNVREAREALNLHLSARIDFQIEVVRRALNALDMDVATIRYEVGIYEDGSALEPVEMLNLEGEVVELDDPIASERIFESLTDFIRERYDGYDEITINLVDVSQRGAIA